LSLARTLVGFQTRLQLGFFNGFDTCHGTHSLLAGIIKQLVAVFHTDSNVRVGVLLARLVEAFADDFVGRRRVKGRWKNTDITRLTGKVELRLLWAKKR